MSQIPPTPPYRQPENSGKAVASLVISIVSLFVCMFLGIVGIVLGHLALKDIRDSGGALTGDGLAKAGIIIGWIDVALSILLMCIWMGAIAAFFRYATVP